MSVPKFTPGPWLVARNECHAGQIATIYAVRGGYAEIWSENWALYGLSEDVQESNLAVIAAAPELYEALDQLRTVMACHDSTPEEFLALANAVAVLAKAVLS